MPPPPPSLPTMDGGTRLPPGVLGSQEPGAEPLGTWVWDETVMTENSREMEATGPLMLAPCPVSLESGSVHQGVH